MIWLFFASLGLVSLGIVCVSVGELSINFDIVLYDGFVSCFL